MAHADSANDLRLMIKLGDEAGPQQLDAIAGDLTMQDEDEDDPGQSFKR